MNYNEYQNMIESLAAQLGAAAAEAAQNMVKRCDHVLLEGLLRLQANSALYTEISKLAEECRGYDSPTRMLASSLLKMIETEKGIMLANGGPRSSSNPLQNALNDFAWRGKPNRWAILEREIKRLEGIT